MILRGALLVIAAAAALAAQAAPPATVAFELVPPERFAAGAQPNAWADGDGDLDLFVGALRIDLEAVVAVRGRRSVTRLPAVDVAAHANAPLVVRPASK